jgi:hypothetical protein
MLVSVIFFRGDVQFSMQVKLENLDNVVEKYAEAGWTIRFPAQ